MENKEEIVYPIKWREIKEGDIFFCFKTVCDIPKGDIGIVMKKGKGSSRDSPHKECLYFYFLSFGTMKWYKEAVDTPNKNAYPGLGKFLKKIG